MNDATDLLIPDEVVLQPHEYDLPAYLAGTTIGQHLNKHKQPVTIARKQIQYFGERGLPWADIEKFYGVSRVTLMRHYKVDYDKGVATTNIALRNKLVTMALAGSVPILIFVAKNRLNMSDLGETKDPETDEDLRTKSTEELLELAKILAANK